MYTTAEILCKSFDEDCLPSIPVLIDYWGRNTSNEEIIYLIYNVYYGLYLKGITSGLFHKCFLSNKLDELIHKKYKHKSSDYYHEFVKKKISIGNTYYDMRTPEDKDVETENEDFEILDDNTCPSCYSDNYYTENYIKGAPNCAVCRKWICNLCSYYDNNEYSNVCYHCCDTSSLKHNIKRKLSTYKNSDMKYFGREGTLSFDDISELLRRQNFKCYICDEIVITCKWKPFCCYQFSIDRINNELPSRLVIIYHYI